MKVHWNVTLIAFLLGLLSGAFSFGLYVGGYANDMRQIKIDLCKEALANNEIHPLVVTNTQKIVGIEKDVDDIKKTVEITRKENREEHLKIADQLAIVLKAVK